MFAKLSALLLLLGGVSAYVSQPHIVFIVADDLGWNDVGYKAGSEISTPNLQLLAEEGVILDQYYVQPTSTASRAALMSGKMPIKLGLQHGVITPDRPSCMPEDVFTLPQKLSSLGYSTRGLGKWHLGFYKESCMPTNRGFDTYLGSMAGSGHYFTHERCVGNDCGYDLKDGMRNAVEHNGTYSTHLYSDEAVDIIENHAEDHFWEPLFLYVAFQASHGPLEVPQKYYDAYTNVANENRRRHAATVAAMDEAIGNIRSSLMENNMWENTILIFTTDNGAAFKRGGSNWPLRGHKGSLFEGAVRGVGLVSGPHLGDQQGTVNTELMHITDWYPTLVDLAYGSSRDIALDGKDVWDILSEGAVSERDSILLNIDPLHPYKGENHYPDIFDVRMHAALRLGDYKLLTGDQGKGYDTDSTGMSYHFKEEAPGENLRLFNVVDDPEELMDVSADANQQELILRMLNELRYYHDTLMINATFPAKDPMSRPKYHGGFWEPWQ